MGLLRNILFKVLYKTGAGHFLLSGNRKRGLVPILIFHKIMPEYDPVWPGIHPRLFEEIIVLLKKHYQILPLNQLQTGSIEELKGACFITFDDGYKDYLDYAFPILKRHDAHSTLFVLPPDPINQGHIWTSTIIFFVKHYSFSEIKRFFEEHNCKINLNRNLNDFQLNLTIAKYLCGYTQKERGVIIEDLQRKFAADNRIIENELLSMAELKTFDKELIGIASHSLTHPGFILETDETFIEKELRESKRILVEELNADVRAFAFPFAQYNDLSLSIVKKYYKLCFTGINESVDLNKLKEDKETFYHLDRYNIHHYSAEEVFFLINGFHKMFGR